MSYFKGGVSMKRLLLAITLVVAVAAFASSSQACGDKFLVNSKNIQQDGMLSVLNPGSVLMYRNPNSELAQLALNDDLVKDLVEKGYKVTVVTDIEGIEDVAADGHADVIMADYADVASIQIETDRPLHFLPVVAKDAKDDAKAAKEEFGMVFKSNTRSFTAVLVIDDALRKALDEGERGEAAASP